MGNEKLSGNRSALSFSDESGGRDENRGLFAIRGQQFAGFRHLLPQLVARPVLAAQRHERSLAARGVLAGCLAHGGGIGRQIQKVVGKLEGEADLFAEETQPLPFGNIAAGDDCACLAGKTQQCTGFHSLQCNDTGFIRCFFLRSEIERLAAGHTADARRAGKRKYERGLALGRKRIFVRCDDIEGKRQQAVAGENCGRLIEFAMHGRLAAAQVVVVHGRQIVMNKRITMEAFQCRANIKGGFGIPARKGGTFDDEERPQAFTAVQHAMAHGVEQVLRARDLIRAGFARKQAAKQGFGFGCVFAQLRFEICHRSVHAALFGMPRECRQTFS
ncbi:hypothetical protein AGR7B_Cc270182 [Agrobacterium deltaense RV3]|nr:hypothetical protein AGR7B_Cc270182 [Agrobacterium deltaense RV3]